MPDDTAASARFVGIGPTMRRRLALGAVVSFVGPWLLGSLVKTFYQPGLHPDPLRSQLLIDFVVVGAIVLLLTMVLTWAFGAWILAVMKGPHRDGDAFPEGARACLHDD